MTRRFQQRVVLRVRRGFWQGLPQALRFTPLSRLPNGRTRDKTIVVLMADTAERYVTTDLIAQVK